MNSTFSYGKVLKSKLTQGGILSPHEKTCITCSSANQKFQHMSVMHIFLHQTTRCRKSLSKKNFRLPGEIAALICLEAEYICLTKGIRFINHSPSQKTVAPIHDETKTPTKNTKTKDVTNPNPAS